MAQDTTYIRQFFEGIRDERGTHQNTATRIGTAFLLLLDYLASIDYPYLRKDIDDTAEGHITFLKGITAHLESLFEGLTFQDILKSEGASDGNDGTGIYMDATTGTISTDGLNVRGWMSVAKLVYNMIQVMEQDYQFSGGGDIERVVANHDGTYTLYIHKEKEDRHTSFGDFDILYGKVDELQESGQYYTSWMRVCEGGVTLNEGMTPDTVRVELWDDAQVPGGRNFAPKDMMTVARRGNTQDAGRQSYWELSTTDERITYYWHVDQPILRADNYALCLGILPTILDNAGLLPSTRDRSMPSLYVNTIFYENAHHIYYPSRVVKEDRGEWTATPTTTYTGMGGTYDGTTYVQGQTISEPYHHESFSRNIWLTHRLSPSNQSLSDAELLSKMRNEWHVDLETSRVWRSGVLWECLVDGTTQAPSEGCTDWSPIQRPSTVYTIMPSMNAIHVVRTDTGYVSPTGGKFVSLRAGYKRSEGNVITMVEDATEQFSGQTIYFRRHLRSTGEWETYYYSYANATNRRALVVVPDAATSGLNVDMYDMVEFSISSSTASVATALDDVKDRMTVPVIADGADGEQGEQGEQGESGAPAEFYSLEIQGGISSVDFSANFAGIITARPSQVTLLLRHVVGNTQEYLSDVPAGMTLEHLLDNDTWETTFLGIRATEDDLSDGTYDTAYRLMRGSTVISTVSLSSHWSYQRMLLPTGRWDATKTYERTPTTTPLVLYAREDGGDDCYYFLDADRAQGSSGQNKPAMSGSYWQLANEYDVVLTKMLFAQFAQLGGYIVYDKYFFSRFGTLVAADGSETVIDNETAALTDVTGQKGGSSFTAIPYGWFDPSDPMPSGTHSPSTSYKFRPMKCINAMSGEEWASGGNVHFSDNGDVDINGTIRTKNLYRSVALCWGQVDAVGGVKTCTLEPGGAAKTYLYVKSLKNEDSPALAAKYGFKPGDYFEYTSEMKNSADADGFDGGMSWSDINDNDFVPCTYSADLVELLDNTERGAFYPYEGTVYLPLPQTFLGKRIEVRHNNTEGTARALVKTVDPTQNYFMLCPELDGHGDLKPSGDTTSSSVTMLAGQTAFFYSVGTYWLYFPSGGGERDINERCKGLYLTAAKLSGAQPSPRVGDWAYVGNGFPATIYVCEVAGTWTNSGQTYDGGSVSLTDYATKAYVHGRFRLLSEADYEQIERQGLTDDTILYMTPEE